MLSEKHSDARARWRKATLTHLRQHLSPGGGLGSLWVLLQELSQFVFQLLHFVYVLLQFRLKGLTRGKKAINYTEV